MTAMEVVSVYMHCQLFWFKLWDPLFKGSNQYQYFGCGKVSYLISVNVGQSSLSVKFFLEGGIVNLKIKCNKEKLADGQFLHYKFDLLYIWGQEYY